MEYTEKDNLTAKLKAFNTNLYIFIVQKLHKELSCQVSSEMSLNAYSCFFFFWQIIRCLNYEKKNEKRLWRLYLYNTGHMLWFNFILSFNFIFLCFGVWKCIIIDFKQSKIKFKPRINNWTTTHIMYAAHDISMSAKSWDTLFPVFSTRN